MKRIIIAAFVIGLVFSPSVFAQNWTAEQLEILENVKTGWTLWGEAVEKKDINIWLDGVNPTEDFQGWWTSEGGLWGRDNERTFSIYLLTVKSEVWENIRPLSIRIFDDTALIYYYATFQVQDHSGKWTRHEEKRLEVSRRQDGKWRWTGAMVVGKALESSVICPWSLETNPAHMVLLLGRVILATKLNRIPTTRHLQYAKGNIALGLVNDASDELEAIDWGYEPETSVTSSPKTSAFAYGYGGTPSVTLQWGANALDTPSRGLGRTGIRRTDGRKIEIRGAGQDGSFHADAVVRGFWHQPKDRRPENSVTL